LIACQKIVQSRITDSTLTSNNSRPNTPSSLGFYRQYPINSVLTPQQTSNGIANSNNSVTTQPVITSPTHLIHNQTQQSLQTTNFNNSQNTSHLKPIVPNNNSYNQKPPLESGPVPPKRIESKVSENKVPLTSLKPLVEQSITNMHKDTKDLPTPSSTPTTARKTRRRSNLFPPLSNKKHLEEKYKTGEVGSGRAIPVRYYCFPYFKNEYQMNN
jgi:Arf-GAP/GTPase/ANK repeat/PH domain-containing protein 1/3